MSYDPSHNGTITLVMYLAARSEHIMNHLPSKVIAANEAFHVSAGTGRTMAENLAGCPELSPGQDVILPLDSPIKSSGHLQILYGNLAPEGSVAKITGKEGLVFTGQVRQLGFHGGLGFGVLSCRV